MRIAYLPSKFGLVFGLALFGALVPCPVSGLQVDFKKEKGKEFTPVPALHVIVEPIELYRPGTGDELVGILTLNFSKNEIGNDTDQLANVVKEEAGQAGASAAYRLSITLDPESSDIRTASYRCIHRMTKKPTPHKKKNKK